MKLGLSKPDTENEPRLGQSANATEDPIVAKVNTSKEGGAEEGGSLCLDEGSISQSDFEAMVPATPEARRSRC